MSKLLTLVLLLLGSTTLFAQNALVVHQKNGGQVTYALSEKPKVTYISGSLVLTTKSVTVEYPLSNLDKFTFTDITDAITETKANSKGITFDSEKIVIEGELNNSIVSIFNASGTIVKSAKCDSNGNVQLYINDLTKGTYIVKTNKTTFKILKK